MQNATTNIYTLSLHDALPIFTRHLPVQFRPLGRKCERQVGTRTVRVRAWRKRIRADLPPRVQPGRHARSEEHTSELQSHVNLVYRLPLEKNKKDQVYAQNEML